ncbi:MAG: PepSY-like domain-containing protein [Prevotella sp.]|nr:PepSY-like domain-containing protein [Prevotella sp.]
MKKLALMALMCITLSGSCIADDRIIPVEQLPSAAQSFIKKTFPGQKISYAQIDRDGLTTNYEVRLDDGTEVTFNKKGKWDQVDCEKKPVPASLVPSGIMKYVKSKFPDTFIEKIDKERNGYEIELSNDLDLRFDKKGKLKGLDD